MAEEMNVSSQNKPKIDAPASPVSVETEVANTNTSAEAKNASESQQTPDSGNQQSVASFRDEKSAGSYHLVEKAGGQRVLEFIADEKAEDANAQEEKNGEVKDAETAGEETASSDEQPKVTETATQAGETLSQEPAPYTLDELTAAISAGNIDDGRVPAEYQQQVANIKIQQAMQRYNQQQEASRKEQKQQLARQELTPEQQAAQMQEFLKNVDQEAAKRAAQDAGLSAEEVENLELMDDDDDKKINFKLAKEWRRSEIYQSLQRKYNEENTRRQQQAAIYQSINDFTAEARTKEPNFDAIDRLMTSRIKNLSYEKGVEIVPVLQALQAGTITEEQTVKLREYYEDTRKAYYASKNKLSTTPKPAPKPPVVEKPGNGVETKKAYKPDYQALSKAGARGRIEWMKEYLRNMQQ